MFKILSLATVVAAVGFMGMSPVSAEAGSFRCAKCAVAPTKFNKVTDGPRPGAVVSSLKSRSR
jgi:hypothetical protein